MALFGKKTTTKEAPQEEVATFTDDFSPEALEALAESLDSGEGKVQRDSALHVRKPVTFKSGSVLGINIGADSMKAVELTAKGSSCQVTGLAIAPTPPDSIANGVVMSVNVLADAVKELIAPFKTKKVVTSVAGTGEVIVRVIEVPTMTDAELQENMNTDLDRYIPFPPSEVQWDAAAMRDLPMDPNATNMDVLLVAARHELIDLHLQLLTAAKVDPKAIDVEPLAAARALSGPLSENSTHVDYNDVCAVLDIGASSTEISILRGDELVFTRTVPVAGNTMTQALMDKLNLAHMDAERLKREKGDASPSQQDSEPAGMRSTARTDVASVNENADIVHQDESSNFDDIILPDEVPAENLDVSPAEPAESSDPFDLDLFNQGPSQSEPGEQHQQKMPDAPDEDDSSQLPSKKSQDSADQEIDSEDASLPSRSVTPEASSSEPTTGGAISSFFDFDENELDEHSEQLPTIEGKPQNTEAPPREEEDSDQIDWDDDSYLPSIAQPDGSDVTLPSAFTFPGDEPPAPVAPVNEIAATESIAAPQLGGFSLDGGALVPAIDAKSTLPPVVQEPVIEPAIDIDLSDILGNTTEDAPPIDIDEGLGGTIALDDDIGLDVFSGLGSGLEVEEKPHDEEAVHAVLKPILDDLASELRRSLEYHGARYPDAPVKRIVLVGGGAKMRNLDTYFSQNLGVPTTIGNPLQSLSTDESQVNQQLIEDHGSSFVVALGLALREIIR